MIKRRFVSPQIVQKIMNSILWASGILTIIILIIIIGYILINGLPVINLQFLTESPIEAGRAGGIAPMIVSSIYVTLTAIIVATPLGVGAAIYLAEYAAETSLIKVIRFTTQTLAAIPSIVYGLFGLAFLSFLWFRIFIIIRRIGISVDGTSYNIIYCRIIY